MRWEVNRSSTDPDSQRKRRRWSVCGVCVECVCGASAGNQIEKRGTTDGPPAGADEADEDAAGSASVGFLSEF